MKFRIAFDIGIGSVGWAVINTEEGKKRIELFGTRIYESGENVKGKASYCQERRVFRSVRRLERRRSFRKKVLRNLFDDIGLKNAAFEDDLLACKDADVYTLKVKGLDEQLTPAELFKCLVHTCNHRGYRDFYETSVDSDEATDEEGVNKQAVSEFDERFNASEKRTVSEFLLESCKEGNFVRYRNTAGSGNECLPEVREGK